MFIKNTALTIDHKYRKKHQSTVGRYHLVSRKKQLLILGGGFAGVRLALLMSKHPKYQVSLITPGTFFEYHATLYKMATTGDAKDSVFPYAKIFEGTNVHVINDEAISIFPIHKNVRSASGEIYLYDCLAICVGNQPDYFGIPGMQEHSSTMYTIRDTQRLKDNFSGLVKQKNGHQITFNIIGSGPSGTELAGNIRYLGEEITKKSRLKPLNLKVKLIEAGPRVLPALSEEVSNIAQKRLEKLGVEVLLNYRVKECTDEMICTIDKNMLSDMTVWCAGSRASQLISSIPDAVEINNRGKAEVDQNMRAFINNIFVLGDAANTKFSGMAQTAVYDAEFVAKYLFGKKPVYDPKPPLYSIPIGDNWAVNQIGEIISYGKEAFTQRESVETQLIKRLLKI